MPIDTFAPAYSEVSIHRRISIAGDGKVFLAAVKGLLQGCGWNVAQNLKGRGALLGRGAGVPFSTPLLPGESPPATVGCPSVPHGRVGAVWYQYYDPLRQIPGTGCRSDRGIGVQWVETGADGLATVSGLVAPLAAGLGITSVVIGPGPTPDTLIFYLDGGSLASGDITVFGLGLASRAQVSDSYYNTLHPAVTGFSVEGAGWEMISPDGEWLIELTYRLDNLNRPVPGPLAAISNRMAPCIRVKPYGGTYSFVYAFSTAPSVYRIYASEHQLIIWADGVVGPLGHPTEIIISSLAIPDGTPAFVSGNLHRVLVVIGSTISSDGSYFLGDNNTEVAQVRNRLTYTRGVAQDFYSFVDGDDYTQSSGAGGIPVRFDSGRIGFVTRGIDANRDLLATNGEPLAQNAWVVASQKLYTAPSWIVGKLRDAMLLSTSAGSSPEGIITKDSRKWHLVSSQRGVGVNGSLWITAATGSD